MSDDDYVFSYTLGDEMPKLKKPKNKRQKKSDGSEKRYKSHDDGFIRIQLEKNKRGGKTVSVIYNFTGGEDLQELCSEIKKRAGTGGAIKGDRIEIQGDKRDVIEKYLESKGYKSKRVGG